MRSLLWFFLPVTVISPAVNTFFPAVVESEGVEAAKPVSDSGKQNDEQYCFFHGMMLFRYYIIYITMVKKISALSDYPAHVAHVFDTKSIHVQSRVFL